MRGCLESEPDRFSVNQKRPKAALLVSREASFQRSVPDFDVLVKFDAKSDRTLRAQDLFNLDLARLGSLCFGQGQRQNTVLHFSLDLLLVDPVRGQAKAPPIVPDVVLRVDWLQLLVFEKSMRR